MHMKVFVYTYYRTKKKNAFIRFLSLPGNSETAGPILRLSLAGVTEKSLNISLGPSRGLDQHNTY